MPTVQSVGGPTTYGSGANVTVTAPAGITNGDFLLAGVFIAASTEAPDPVPPPGWQEISGGGTDVTDSGGFNGEMRFFWKIASQESGNYTWKHATASRQGAILRISGVDTGNPFACLSTKNTGNGVTATATGLTTHRDNTLVIFWGQDWGDTANNLAVPTGSTPTFSDEHIPGTATGIQYCCSGTLASAGATGNKSHTSNNNAPNNNPWARLLIALNPPLDIAGEGEGGLVVGSESSFVGEGTIGSAESADEAVLAGTSSLTFTTSGNLAASASLSGTTSLTFTTSGALTATAGLSGTSSLTFSPAGSLIAGARMSATSALTFSTTANLNADANLSGTSSVTFSPTAILTADAGLSGSTSLTFSPTASLNAVAGLSGTTSLTFTPTGDLTADGDSAISGATSLTFTTEGNLSATAVMSGTSSLTFTPTGDLQVDSGEAAELSGTTSLTFSTTANLNIKAGLSGTSGITFSPTAVLRADAFASGTSSLTFATSANLAVTASLSGTSSIKFITGSIRTPSFVAFTSNANTGDRLTLNVNYPLGLVAGHILLLFVNWSGDDDVLTTPTDFTQIGTPGGQLYGQDPSGNDMHSAVFWKRATGSESGFLTVEKSNFSPADSIFQLAMLAYKDCLDVGDPIEGWSEAIDTTDPYTMNSVTTLGPRRRVVCSFINQDNFIRSTGPASGWTNQLQSFTPSGNDSSIIIDDIEQVSEGSPVNDFYGPAGLAVSGVHAFALKPGGLGFVNLDLAALISGLTSITFSTSANLTGGEVVAVDEWIIRTRRRRGR